jgi:probable rRNA maturation factor
MARPMVFCVSCGAKIEIINLQKIRRLDLKKLQRYLKEISSLIGISSSRISVTFCDNKLIRGLNKKFFKRYSPTDVISFPLNDNFDPYYLGEVVVSVEEALNLSKKYKKTWQEELILYIVHGILHLVGYSDRTNKKRRIMERKQKSIMEKLFG